MCGQIMPATISMQGVCSKQSRASPGHAYKQRTGAERPSADRVWPWQGERGIRKEGGAPGMCIRSGNRYPLWPTCSNDVGCHVQVEGPLGSCSSTGNMGTSLSVCAHMVPATTQHVVECHGAVWPQYYSYREQQPLPLSPRKGKASKPPHGADVLRHTSQQHQQSHHRWVK
jgi:hypothetical protein